MKTASHTHETPKQAKYDIDGYNSYYGPENDFQNLADNWKGYAGNPRYNQTNTGYNCGGYDQPDKHLLKPDQ